MKVDILMFLFSTSILWTKKKRNSVSFEKVYKYDALKQHIYFPADI